jgi:endoglucanase
VLSVALLFLTFLNRVRAAALSLLLLGILAAAGASAQGTGYWHTSGSQIYDANNQAVRIAGINWYGFETTDLVAHGLSSQDYKTILDTIKAQGFNTVRMPLSNQMVESPSSSLNISFWSNYTAINTDLRGLNSLQVLDKIVAYAGTIGLKIILDNHRSEAGNSAEANGLWFTGAYPEASWIADWQALATRYADNPTIIGFDLRNEPHNANSGGACWDCGGANDWHLAAERGGDAVLAINPNLLLFVEGTDAYGNDYYWWGGNLEGVAKSPVTLSVPKYAQSWFSNASPASLQAVWTAHWAYVAQQKIAPVWLGEFGTQNRDSDAAGSTPGSQGQWFQSLVGLLNANPELNWTYWALNGEDAYGLLDSNYDAAPVSPAKQAVLASIQFPLNSAVAPPAPTGLTASAASSSQINLGWTASTGNGVTYSVWFGTSSGSVGTLLAAGLTTPAYQATGLNSSSQYFFTVSASNAVGKSPVSAVVSATTPANVIPNTPTGLTAAAASSSAINLAWLAGTTPGTTYSIYSEQGLGGGANQIANGVSGTSYNVTGLKASATYYFWLVASTAAGSSAPSALVGATTNSIAPPATPASLVATATSSTAISVSWTASATGGVTYSLFSGSTAASTPNVVATGLMATSLSVSGLTPSTTYFFTVKAISVTASSAASNSASATTQAASVAAPSAPFGLSASAASASQINLNWQPSNSANVTYSVFYGTASGAASTLAASGLTATNFSVFGLLDNTAYFFTVKAVSAGGAASPASNQAVAATQALPATPPTALAVSVVSSSQINLSWTAVPNTGATYAVFYGTSSGAENTQLATGIGGTTYAATGLTASTTYYFVVRSISAGGTSAPSAQALATTLSVSGPSVPVTPPTQPTAPSAPTGLTASAASSTQINLAWAPSSTSGVTYTLYAGSSAGSVSSVVASGIAGTVFSVQNLQPSTAYFYAVTATNTVGSSAASNVASVTTQAPAAPAAPTGLTAATSSSTQINLSWSASATTGVSYSVYSGAAGGAETTLVASGLSGTSYPVQNLTASKAYFFIVKAVSGSGSASLLSAASNQAAASTQAAATGGCHVTYTNQNDWGAGFTGALSITNLGSSSWAGWTVTWTFAGNQQIYQAWSSNYTQNGSRVTLSNAAWNGAVAAGGTVSAIGWNANYSGVNTTPAQFSVNGVACH